jgi:mevalonate kinase
MKLQLPSNFVQFYEGIRRLSEEYEISIENLRIRLFSDLWKGSGLGSSASISVAFIHAIETYFKLNLTPQEINEYAYQMEKIVHGTPSGIDNSICAYGGIIVFQNGIQEKIITPKFPILITYSGEPHNTGTVIQKIKDKKEILIKPFQNISEIVEMGLDAIKSKNYIQLGKLFSQNQEILVRLGLSTPKIDEIISLSEKNGAYGSKLTGAGAGGSVLTIGELSNLQKIQFLLQKKGYICRICYLDYNGMRIDSK